MKEMDLMRAMSDLEEKYVLEAAPDEAKEEAGAAGRRNGRWRPGRVRAIASLVAACFLLVISLGIYRLRSLPSGTQQDKTQEAAVEEAVGAPEGAQMDEGAQGAVAEMDAAEMEVADPEGSNAVSGQANAPENFPAAAAQSGMESEMETETETETETDEAADF